MTKWYLIAIVALAMALATGWVVACDDDDDDERAAVFDDDDSTAPGGGGGGTGDDDDAVDDDDDAVDDDDDDTVDPYEDCRDTLNAAVDQCAVTEDNTYDEMVCVGEAWGEAVDCLSTAGMSSGDTDCITNAIAQFGNCLALCDNTDETCLLQCKTDLETESNGGCGFDPNA